MTEPAEHDMSCYILGETGGGKVVQRFPEKDWPDVPCFVDRGPQHSRT